MSRIFISYKRVDKDKVFKIKDQIESALGEKCWIDLDGIESDAQFMNVIINAIRECEVLLFMYSKTHAQITDFEKDWTVRELNFASKKEKRIVFVNIDGAPLSDEFEFMYGTKQQVDGRSVDALNKLYTDLKLWLFSDLKQKHENITSTIERTNIEKGNSENVQFHESKEYERNFEEGLDSTDIENLIAEVSGTSYIQNLRIGRSWILPQMVQLAFDKNGKFNEKKYFNEIQTMDYEKSWIIALRNFHALSVLDQKNKKAFQERFNWWNKAVAVAIAENDLRLFKKYLKSVPIRYDCFGGPYIYLRSLKGRKDKWYDQMFFVQKPCVEWKKDKKTTAELISEFEDRIGAIKAAKDFQELWATFENYAINRCIMKFTTTKGVIPLEFVNAFSGDGAYSAMMTMVKFLNLTYSINNQMLSRDECIADIMAKPKEFKYNGVKMFRYCSLKLLDEKQGGSFSYKEYKGK